MGLFLHDLLAVLDLGDAHLHFFELEDAADFPAKCNSFQLCSLLFGGTLVGYAIFASEETTDQALNFCRCKEDVLLESALFDIFDMDVCVLEAVYELSHLCHSANPSEEQVCPLLIPHALTSECTANVPLDESRSAVLEQLYLEFLHGQDSPPKCNLRLLLDLHPLLHQYVLHLSHVLLLLTKLLE